MNPGFENICKHISRNLYDDDFNQAVLIRFVNKSNNMFVFFCFSESIMIMDAFITVIRISNEVSQEWNCRHTEVFNRLTNKLSFHSHLWDNLPSHIIAQHINMPYHSTSSQPYIKFNLDAFNAPVLLTNFHFYANCI